MTSSTVGITSVRTVAVPVRDQDRALAFYRDVLGLDTRLDVQAGPVGRWLEVAPPASSTSIALAAAPAGGVGVDTGIRLTTVDAAAARAALADAGADVDAELLTVPVPMFTFRDPDGNRLVIVEDRGGA